ncbi:NUDIX domain-containing protein [Candidatus Saccharibacteria bacterium CPR2]|nr:NUDIX domain-containing protein [Candidatus Saccharibacteria bacterium CPR2]
MPKQSAGILLYKIENDSLKVLLVHPGGPFWAKKDNGVWSIPKGEYEPKDNALKAAKREFEEEIGSQSPESHYEEIGEVHMKSGKAVRAWAVEGDLDVNKIKSNTFEMQWPPRSGQIQTFSEVDKAEWFESPVAKVKINMAQIPFVERLEKLLKIKQTTDDLNSKSNMQRSLFEN